ncbi:MFS transporter [Rhodococcus hoagii]|nr:MFS transporter [Prescottella equi]
MCDAAHVGGALPDRSCDLRFAQCTTVNSVCDWAGSRSQAREGGARHYCIDCGTRCGRLALGFCLRPSGALLGAYLVCDSVRSDRLAVRALPTFETVLVGRVAEGMMLAGVPVTAITYARELLPTKYTARAAGFFVGGAAVGGWAGRLISSTLADSFGWRAGLFASSGFSTAVVILFLLVAPRRAHRTRPPRAGGRVGWKSLVTGRQAAMYAQAFLLTGAFFALYNYVGFRLSRDPFNLSQQQIGLIYGTYLAGTFASLSAGCLVGAVGRRPVLLFGTGAIFLGGAVTLASNLWILVCGLVLVTAGFFGAHSVVSGWVGAEVSAGTRASSIYTLAYYGGASLFGWLGGEAYQSYSWPGLVAGVMFLTTIAAIFALALLTGERSAAEIVRQDMQVEAVQEGNDNAVACP